MELLTSNPYAVIAKVRFNEDYYPSRVVRNPNPIRDVEIYVDLHDCDNDYGEAVNAVENDLRHFFDDPSLMYGEDFEIANREEVREAVESFAAA